MQEIASTSTSGNLQAVCIAVKDLIGSITGDFQPDSSLGSTAATRLVHNTSASISVHGAASSCASLLLLDCLDSYSRDAHNNANDNVVC